MSDLQLSLLALGAAIIAAVMLFNWWQERQLSNEVKELNLANPDALLFDQPAMDQFDTSTLDEDVVVTRRTPDLPDESNIAHDMDELPDAQDEVAQNQSVQDEPSFEINHKSDFFENEPTLDLGSTTWEKLSGEKLNSEKPSSEMTGIQDSSEIESVETETEAEINELNLNDDADVHAIASSVSEETAFKVHSTEAIETQKFEPEIFKPEIVGTKAPATVELTEEELDILNAIPAAPPSFLAQKLSTSSISANANVDAAATMENKQHTIAAAMSHHQESTMGLRHDGLPAQIIDEIDFAGLIAFAEPTSGSVLTALNIELSTLGKPIQAFGLTTDNAWTSFTQDQGQGTYLKVVYAIQLADRSGPTSKITLHKFQSAIEAHAKKVGAQVEWHGQPDPSAYAVDLDGFCVQVDQLIRFHLIQGASGPFTGTKFRGLAESSGLTLGENGAFHYINDHGQTLFSIFNADNNPFNAEMLRNIGLRSVNFELDIPRVANSTEAFNLMLMAAKKMEASLFAHLVDDNQKALTDVHLEKIRQQLRVINSQMVARGIMPGSACALRLFS